jgi:SPASM domain peptide maturase of grasp-with-spasm system
MKNYFKLFSNCIITKGYRLSLISDLQLERSEVVPNDMVEVVEYLNNEPISSLEGVFGLKNKTIIEEYIDYLVKNDYGFYCDEFDLNSFIELKKEFISPYHITNAIIECDSEKKLQCLKTLSSQLELLGCRNFTLFFYFDIEKTVLSNYIKIFNSTRLVSFDIFLKYNAANSIDIIKMLKTTINKVKNIVFYDSPKDKKMDFNEEQLFDVLFLKENIKDFKRCGIVDIKYFNTNLPKVLESINHNSCLHKKIAIDKDGNIKNCPSMVQSFGNIKDTTLEEALNHPDFKKYWNISKDQIEVCKDCEFRHICTDCRAYIEEPENQYSKPLKCGYNPYTNLREEWSTNPLKKKAIEYYGMLELVKKNG